MKALCDSCNDFCNQKCYLLNRKIKVNYVPGYSHKSFITKIVAIDRYSRVRFPIKDFAVDLENYKGVGIKISLDDDWIWASDFSENEETFFLDAENFNVI